MARPRRFPRRFRRLPRHLPPRPRGCCCCCCSCCCSCCSSRSAPGRLQRPPPRLRFSRHPAPRDDLSGRGGGGAKRRLREARGSERAAGPRAVRSRSRPFGAEPTADRRRPWPFVAASWPFVTPRGRSWRQLWPSGVDPPPRRRSGSRNSVARLTGDAYRRWTTDAGDRRRVEPLPPLASPRAPSGGRGRGPPGGGAWPRPPRGWGSPAFLPAVRHPPARQTTCMNGPRPRPRARRWQCQPNNFSFSS